MNRMDLANVLGMNFVPQAFGKVGNMFYGKIIANFRNDESNLYKWSDVISKERLNKMRQSKGIEILAQDEKTVLYRSAGKLFVNKKFEDGIRGKRIL